MRKIDLYDNPVMQDFVVQEINNLLTSHIEYRFGIAQMGYDEEGNTYPSIYYNDGSVKNEMLFPDNKVKSFCFWEFLGMEVLDEDEGVNYNLALVFWGNLKRIDSSKRYDFTSEIEQSIIKVLKGYGAVEISLEEEDIFSIYSKYLEEEKQTLLRPNTGFKITFKLHDIPCLES